MHAIIHFPLYFLPLVFFFPNYIPRFLPWTDIKFTHTLNNSHTHPYNQCPRLLCCLLVLFLLALLFLRSLPSYLWYFQTSYFSVLFIVPLLLWMSCSMFANKLIKISNWIQKHRLMFVFPLCCNISVVLQSWGADRPQKSFSATLWRIKHTALWDPISSRQTFLLFTFI